MTRTLATLAVASLIVIGTPATSSSQPAISRAQWGQPRGDFQRAYENGYRSGLREGERDARSGRRRDYRQHDGFRRGNSGWGWGNGGGDADVFRRGFAEGYLAGYDRFGGNGRGYGRPAYGYPDAGARPGWNNPGPGWNNQGGMYGRSPASQRGFDDGYRDGRNDARDNDRYEPTRKKKYREGDEGYSNRYGSRDQYKHEYRQAFQHGYDRGYREGRYR